MALLCRAFKTAGKGVYRWKWKTDLVSGSQSGLQSLCHPSTCYENYLRRIELINIFWWVIKTSNWKLLKGCPKGEEVVDPLDSAMESFWSHHNDRIWTYEQVQGQKSNSNNFTWVVNTRVALWANNFCEVSNLYLNFTFYR